MTSTGSTGTFGAPSRGSVSAMSLALSVLLVEAAVPGLVATLRYAENALVATLAEVFGPGRVKAVRVVPPRGSRSGGQPIRRG